MPLSKKLNIEQKKAKWKEYYLKNHDHILARERAYKAANREEVNAKLREWHAKNKNKRSEYHRKQNQALRKLVFDHYGWICVGCGESDPDVLTVDHINGDGKKHRASIRGSLYSWLKQNGFPSGFRTLCWNCNSGRAKRGIPLPNERLKTA